MAREGRLAPLHMEALALTISRFHANALRYPQTRAVGAMAHLIDLNAIPSRPVRFSARRRWRGWTRFRG